MEPRHELYKIRRWTLALPCHYRRGVSTLRQVLADEGQTRRHYFAVARPKFCLRAAQSANASACTTVLWHDAMPASKEDGNDFSLITCNQKSHGFEEYSA